MENEVYIKKTCVTIEWPTGVMDLELWTCSYGLGVLARVYHLSDLLDIETFEWPTRQIASHLSKSFYTFGHLKCRINLKQKNKVYKKKGFPFSLCYVYVYVCVFKEEEEVKLVNQLVKLFGQHTIYSIQYIPFFTRLLRIPPPPPPPLRMARSSLLRNPMFRLVPWSRGCREHFHWFLGSQRH